MQAIQVVAGIPVYGGGSLLQQRALFRYGQRDKFAEMDNVEIIHRRCPNCGAQYKVVRVEVNPTDGLREIACVSCGSRLQCRDGESALRLSSQASGEPQAPYPTRPPQFATEIARSGQLGLSADNLLKLRS